MTDITALGTKINNARVLFDGIMIGISVIHIARNRGIITCNMEINRRLCAFSDDRTPKYQFIHSDGC